MFKILSTIIGVIDGSPDFSAIPEYARQAIQDAFDAGDYEIIPDPEPIVELPTPDWDAFNAYMLSDATFKMYRDTVRAIDGDLNSALFDAYGLVAANGTGAFSLVWGQWVLISNITTEDRNTLANVAQSCNLPSDFVIVIRGN